MSLSAPLTVYVTLVPAVSRETSRSGAVGTASLPLLDDDEEELLSDEDEDTLDSELSVLDEDDRLDRLDELEMLDELDELEELDELDEPEDALLADCDEDDRLDSEDSDDGVLDELDDDELLLLLLLASVSVGKFATPILHPIGCVVIVWPSMSVVSVRPATVVPAPMRTEPDTGRKSANA